MGNVQVLSTGDPIPQIPEGANPLDYFYLDQVHPTDTGHQAIAELLAATLATAVDQQQLVGIGSRVAHLAAPCPSCDPTATDLPPPMVPGNMESQTTVCAIKVHTPGVVRLGHWGGPASFAILLTLQLACLPTHSSFVAILHTLQRACLPTLPSFVPGGVQVCCQKLLRVSVQCGAPRRPHLCQKWEWT